MVERVFKATASGWRPWAIGAALSMAGAAIVLLLRSASRVDADDIYEAWWRHREKVRANGDQPSKTDRGRDGNPQLFV